jgi:hypothetical protein
MSMVKLADLLGTGS